MNFAPLLVATLALVLAIGGLGWLLHRLITADTLDGEREAQLAQGLPLVTDATFHDEVQRRSHDFALLRARRAFAHAQSAAGFAGVLVFIALASNEIGALLGHTQALGPAVITATGAIPGTIGASFLIESRLAQADLMTHVAAHRAREREKELKDDAFKALSMVEEKKAKAETAAQLAVLYATAATIQTARGSSGGLRSRIGRSRRRGTPTAAGQPTSPDSSASRVASAPAAVNVRDS